MKKLTLPEGLNQREYLLLVTKRREEETGSFLFPVTVTFEDIMERISTEELVEVDEIDFCLNFTKWVSPFKKLPILVEVLREELSKKGVTLNVIVTLTLQPAKSPCSIAGG